LNFEGLDPARAAPAIRGMLNGKQERLMADKWVKLTPKEEGWIPSEIYVNLSNATSIWPIEGGAQIWFFASKDKNGHFEVTESPGEIIEKGRDADRT
jgi:hypothetical protein